MPSQPTPAQVLASATIIIILAVFTRLIHILPGFTPRRRPIAPSSTSSASAHFTAKARSSSFDLATRPKPAHICIVLGSGGHTAEMLSMIRKLDTRRYTQRTYIVSSGDQFSAAKATEFEKSLAEKLAMGGQDLDESHVGRRRKEGLDGKGNAFITETQAERERGKSVGAPARQATSQQSQDEIDALVSGHGILKGRFLNRKDRELLMASLQGDKGARPPSVERGLQPTDERIHSGDSLQIPGSSYRIITVPRARAIHQRLSTTPFSSLKCFIACIKALQQPYSQSSTIDRSAEALHKRALYSSTPDIILTNGPATGVIVVLASLLLRFLGLDGGLTGDGGEMRTIYVESWARVRTLSLSGRILQHGLVDRFLVQWKSLEGRGREFAGVLVE